MINIWNPAPVPQQPITESDLRRKDGAIVREAAQLLETRGWIKGAMKAGLSMCARGAINTVAAGECLAESVEGIRAETRLGKWLVKNKFIRSTNILWPVGCYRSAVPYWNDNDVVDQEDAVIILRKFADEMDPQR